MKKVLILAFAVVLVAAGISIAEIAGSPHDLTAYTDATLSACQYCHTPHLRNNPAVPGAPLWNRALPNTTYTLYGTTIAGTDVGAPGPNSKTCLSCHDGTIALGNVLVGGSHTITKTGVTDNDGKLLSTIPTNLGTDLSNEHPIGFTFTHGRAGVPSSAFEGANAKFKLYNGKFECASCHEPHDTTYEPFLRAGKNTICTDCHQNK